MKRTLLTIAFIISAFSSFAIRNTATNNGTWSANGTWSLNRIPRGGDSIIIPANRTVTISNDQAFSTPVVLMVAGVLDFQNNSTNLRLTDNSTILVMNGRIKGNGSPSQRIRMGNASIFDGRDEVTGWQMASANTNGFQKAGVSVLPVQFIAYSVTVTGGDVLVQWTTATEENAASFEIERSQDGNTWKKIGSVRAKGTSNNIEQYSFTDRNVAGGTQYYRVKQIDNNGQFMYTAVKQAKTEAAGVKIAGGQGRIVLQIGGEVKGNLVVRLLNLNGQVISQQQLTNGAGQVVLPVGQRGSYVVAVSNNAGLHSASQVLL